MRDGWLHVAVRNPVPQEDAAPSPDGGLGLGLRNLRERLAAQYTGRAHVQWSRTSAGFTVELTLPVETLP